MVEPILYKTRDNPILITEQLIVRGSKSVLKEVPDRFNRVKIDGLIEIDEIEKLNESYEYFYVDYLMGEIHFPTNIINESEFVAKYYGTGYSLYPASRMYLHLQDHDTIEETLQDAITKAEKSIKIVHEISDIDTYVEEGKTLKNNLGQQLTTGDTLNQGLASKITTGTTLKNNLDKNILDGTILKGNLENIISDGTTDIINLKNTSKDEINALSDIEKAEIIEVAEDKKTEVDSLLDEVDNTLNLQYKTIDAGDFGDDHIINTYDGGDFGDITTPTNYLNGGDFMTGAVEYQARSNQYMYMMSPNGVKFKLEIDDNGDITTTTI